MKEKMNKISRQSLWTLLLFSLVFEAIYAYQTGISLMNQATEGLSKYSAQGLAIEAVTMGVIREYIPLNAGLVMAILSPLVSLYGFFKLKKINLYSSGHKTYLVKYKFINNFVVLSIIILCGIVISMLSAYSSIYPNIPTINVHLQDISALVIKFVVFLISISILNLIHIKTLIYCSKKITMYIVSCGFVIINLFSIFVLDYCVSFLLSTSEM